jgi:hypothetical protein
MSQFLTAMAVLGALSLAGENAWALDTDTTTMTNASGTWSCTCSGKGTCSITQTTGTMVCHKGTGTCDGECNLSTVGTGEHPVSPSQVPPKAGGTDALPPASAPPQR